MSSSGEFIFVDHRLNELGIQLSPSDASGLKEPEHVRDSQEKVVQSLQKYTTLNYSTLPAKFGELLLRIPELQRVCQVQGNDSLDVFK